MTGVIQQPLQQALVRYENVPVMTCFDDVFERSCNQSYVPIIRGYDPEPVDMATINQNLIVQDVTSALNTFSEEGINAQICPERSFLEEESVHPYIPQSYREYARHSTVNSETFFVAALQNGTTTGVLRQHAMRLNSSVNYEIIDRTELPSACPGVRPFTEKFSRPGIINVDVCAPGEYGVYPWTLIRNRQDIMEEIFLDVFYLNETFTLQCRATTTRGYFELGNYRNSYRHGPLMDKWPSPEEMKNDFNDVLNIRGEPQPPTEQ